jgi:hypothetical protein
MNKQETLDLVYATLVSIRAAHPLGLRGIASENAHHVMTRHGVDTAVAMRIESIFKNIEATSGMVSNPIEIIDIL